MEKDLVLKKYLLKLDSENIPNKKYYKIVPFLANIYANNINDLKELIGIGNLAVTEALDACSFLASGNDLSEQIEEILIIEYNYYLSLKLEGQTLECENTTSYYDNIDSKIDVSSILENLNDFEKEYILFKYGFYDEIMHSNKECCNEFNIENTFEKLFENKLMKKMRKIYFLK